MLEDCLAGFAEGLALIASPCILPVLPLVLSASVDGGRRRPFGIIFGFILSFAGFALLSRTIVAALGINLDTIRLASLVLLGLFAFTLLSERLSEIFARLTQRVAEAGQRATAGAGSGFTSGIFIGALIGLVWTPCAGPIMAAALVQVIRQQTTLGGTAVILSFGAGAALPMLIIAITGRRLMARLGFFLKHAEAIRKTFGVAILGSVLFIAYSSFAQPDSSALPQTANNAQSTAAQGLEHGLEQGLDRPYPAPDFVGIDSWLNSPPLTMAQLRGKVVLVDFWTYSCINCVRTLPYITAWDKKYRDQGLVIVGVHSPEFEFEKQPDNVRAALAQRGIAYPVALDSKLDTWENFHNMYWPAHYLIDRNGMVVYTHFGEGDYDVTENNIRYLLGLHGPATATGSDQQNAANGPQTPETYVGYSRAERYHGNGTLTADTDSAFTLPKFLPVDTWALGGGWKIGAQKIIATTPGAVLQINFRARKVFLVLGSATGKPIKASLSLNGEAIAGNAGQDAPNGFVTVNHSTLYELVDQKTAQNGLLEIKAETPGLEAYAFTFGG